MQVGQDLPEWWLPYDVNNVLKRECGHWGEQTTEWDAAGRALNVEDTRAVEEGEYSVEEVLYADKDPHPPVPLVSSVDFDPKTRSAFLQWPLQADRMRMQKVEKKLGLPWDTEDRCSVYLLFWYKSTNTDATREQRARIQRDDALEGQAGAFFYSLNRALIEPQLSLNRALIEL